PIPCYVDRHYLHSFPTRRSSDLAASDEPEQRRIHRLDRAAIVDEAFELDDLRNKIQIDRNSVGSNHWFYFQRHTGVARFEIRRRDRKSTRLNSSHLVISYAVFCL